MPFLLCLASHVSFLRYTAFSSCGFCLCLEYKPWEGEGASGFKVTREFFLSSVTIRHGRQMCWKSRGHGVKLIAKPLVVKQRPNKEIRKGARRARFCLYVGPTINHQSVKPLGGACCNNTRITVMRPPPSPPPRRKYPVIYVMRSRRTLRPSSPG